MPTTPADLWARYKKYLCRVNAVGLTLDVSRMAFDDAHLAQIVEQAQSIVVQSLSA